MADEQDRWLDRETAELLLRGESLDAVDPAVRDRAERLAEALHALSAQPPPTSQELPGEAAALAAFRKARTERPDVAPARPGRDTEARPADAGLVRICGRGEGARRSRWGRPVRFGLAAALTVGMVGGVAVAAGTGVLPTPFGGTEPAPAATVSAAATPERPLLSSPSPDGERSGSPPDGAATGPSAPGATRDGTGGGTDADRDPGSDDRARDSGDRRHGLAASCRDLRAGERLDDARRQALKEAAGGSSRVRTYCKGVLAGTGATGRDGDGDSGGDGGETGETGDAAGAHGTRKDTGDEDTKSDKGDKGDKGGGRNKGDKEGKGGKNGKGGDDDSRLPTPHAQGPSGPEGSSAAHEPLRKERPAHSPQSSSATEKTP
ncbi:hypothetical protein GCM10010377_37900 [Streptomyces viridiviolaceus]|uniref:Extensin n=1 Tax=Streptomyces viridiviolaceus TaxID=68282 RepID=A0ABW2E2L2_9ACTN|nr:hypothetical protein [Streptomyces viridiviolaceus]GHB43573.1 hypothetical protein GCM10010377_37900 [Streptomyces viridiviolaceus]